MTDGGKWKRMISMRFTASTAPSDQKYFKIKNGTSGHEFSQINLS